MIRDELVAAYRTLGVSTDSPLSEINRIYRKLAKRFHPDSNTGNPDYSHETIVRINEAYELIKSYYKRGLKLSDLYKHDSEERAYDRGVNTWHSEYERLKAKAKEQQSKTKEREKKEREAFQKILERTVIERKNEIIDEKSFELIEKWAFELISCYFTKNFNNTIFRNLPHTERKFSRYIEIYERQLEEIKRLTLTFRSKLHRQRANSAYEFLNTFIDDAVNSCPINIDRRAHAYQGFQEAAGIYEKFLTYFYSGQQIRMDRTLKMFKNSLDAIKNFLQSFPESPLTRYAEIKILVLDSMYRAFIKKV